MYGDIHSIKHSVDRVHKVLSHNFWQPVCTFPVARLWRSYAVFVLSFPTPSFFAKVDACCTSSSLHISGQSIGHGSPVYCHPPMLYGRWQSSLLCLPFGCMLILL